MFQSAQEIPKPLQIINDTPNSPNLKLLSPSYGAVVANLILSGWLVRLFGQWSLKLSPFSDGRDNFWQHLTDKANNDANFLRFSNRHPSVGRTLKAHLLSKAIANDDIRTLVIATLYEVLRIHRRIGSSTYWSG